MTPDQNPMAALATLGKRLADEAAKLGLYLQQFAILPNPDPNGPHAAQAIFAVDFNQPNGPQSGPETMGSSGVDAEFEAMIEAQRQLDIQQKAKDARESLKELLGEMESDTDDDSNGPF